MVALSAEDATCGALLATGALQGVLDYLQQQSYSTAKQKRQSTMVAALEAQAVSFLRNLMRHDAEVAELIKEHPAVEHLHAQLASPRFARSPGQTWDGGRAAEPSPSKQLRHVGAPRAAAPHGSPMRATRSDRATAAKLSPRTSAVR